MKRLLVLSRSSGVGWATLVIGILVLLTLYAGSPAYLAQAGSQAVSSVVTSPDDANRMGPEGGQISTPDGRLRITIPPGALSEPTQVLLAVTPSSSNSTSFEFDVALGPKSAEAPPPRFAAPVTVDLTPTTADVSRLGANAASLTLKKFDYATNNAIPAPSTPNAAKSSYTAQINEPGHFILSADVPRQSERVEANITAADGGTLQSIDREVRLEFPPGASTDELTVQFEPADIPRPAPFHVVGQFEVNAHAVNRANALANQFSKPLAVTISPSPDELAAWNENSLTLYVLNEVSGVWDKVPDQTTTNGVITASIDHFSTYTYGAMSNIAGPGQNLYHQVDLHSGSVNLNIPISQIPGPGGFQPPDLNISYSSSGVNEMKHANSMGGSLGIGWDINVPAIIRDPGSSPRYFIFFNGVADELIRVSTPIFQTNAKNSWTTKSERYLQIFSKVDGDGQETIWLVYTKDGTVYRFGTDDGGTSTVDWYNLQPDVTLQRGYWQNINGTWYQQRYRFDLGRVEDLHGNYAIYSYHRETYQPCGTCTSVRSAYLNEINWGGNLNTSPQTPHRFRLSTTLNQATDPPRIDAPICTGQPIPAVYESRYITEIRVEILKELNGLPDVVRKYQLQYHPQSGPTCAPVPTSGQLKLWKVRQYGKQLNGQTQGQHLLESEFNYSNYSFSFRYVNAQTGMQDVCPNTDFTRPFLSEAKNGLGGTTTYIYSSLWQQGSPYTVVPTGVCNYFTQQGCQSPIVLPCGNMPTWGRVVVAQETEAGGNFAGSSPAVTHSYSYGDGPKYWVNNDPTPTDPIDAEFRGFRDVTETDATGAYMKCWYYTTGWEPEMGMPADILTGQNFKCQWFNPGGGAYLQSTHPFWFWRAGRATGTNFVYKASEDTYGLHAGCYCQTWAYDSYGNTVGHAESGPGISRSKDTEFYPNVTYWVVGLAASETIREGADMLSRTEYIYDNNTAYNQYPGYSPPPTGTPPKGDVKSIRRNIGATTINKTESFQYDAFGNATQKAKYRDGNAQPVSTTSLTYHYFYNNYLMSQSQSASGAGTLNESYVYDTVLGVRTQVTDANLQVSRFDYDDYGRLVREWAPDESYLYPGMPTATYSHEWNSVPPSKTRIYRREQTGVATDFIQQTLYDGLGREVQKQSEIVSAGPCQLAITDTGYDNVGRKSFESIPYNPAAACSWVDPTVTPDPSVKRTSFQYDGLGRTTLVTNPNDSTVQTTYVSSNGIIRVKDENSHQTERIQDAFGRVTTVKEFLGTPTYTLDATTSYTYDGSDRLKTITDAGTPANTTTLAYDMTGRRQIQDPDMGSWNYTYHDDGLLHTQTDARGETVEMFYDGLGRITQKRYTGPVTPLPPWVNYAYDTCQVSCPDNFSKGQLTSVSYTPDNGRSFKYKYDARGRLTAQQTTVLGTSYDVTTAYDSMDRQTCLTYPGGESVKTNYDAQGLTLSVFATSQAACAGTPLMPNYLSDSDYDAAGNTKRLLYGNGLDLRYDYRANDLRLRSICTASPSNACTPTGADLCPTINAADLLNLCYKQYDGRGHITSVRDNVQAVTSNYVYDERDRLKQANILTGVGACLCTYNYDKIGNLTRKTEGGGSNYTSMGYDTAAGGYGPHAITSATPGVGPQHTFDYDANGNMKNEYVVGLSDPLHKYDYDGDGKISYRKSSGVEAWYAYDHNGNLLLKNSSAGSTIYVSGVYEKAPNGVETKYYFVNGQRIAMKKGTDPVRYITGDHLGSTSLITTAAGLLESRTRYYPYGNVRTQEFGPGYTEVPTDKMFTGQQRETMDGIYHYGARLYNADIGRFPQADTIVSSPGDPQALNRYAYVRNNPMNFVDPTGHCVSNLDTVSCTVESGDSLWGIANTFYGNPYLWEWLYQLNVGVIGGDPNLIFVGQVLLVPPFGVIPGELVPDLSGSSPTYPTPAPAPPAAPQGPAGVVPTPFTPQSPPGADSKEENPYLAYSFGPEVNVSYWAWAGCAGAGFAGDRTGLYGYTHACGGANLIPVASGSVDLTTTYTFGTGVTGSAGAQFSANVCYHQVWGGCFGIGVGDDYFSISLGIGLGYGPKGAFYGWPSISPAAVNVSKVWKVVGW